MTKFHNFNFEHNKTKNVFSSSYTVLLQAKVGVWENKDCAKNYIGRQKVLETMLCASGKKKDACAGDSGGI